MRILLHTGLSKCAGTFCRSVIFPFLEKKNKIKQISTGDNNNILNLIIDILDEKVELTENLLNDIQKKFLEESKINQDIVISSGAMSSHQINTLDISKDFLRRSMILKKIIPEAKIIFIVREQFSLIASQYKSLIQQRYIQNLNEFILTKNEIDQIKNNDYRKGFDPYKRQSNLPWFNPQGLNYFYFIKMYFDIFGPKNCLVIFAENLQSNEKKENEIYKLINFIKPNRDEAKLLSQDFHIYSSEKKIPSLSRNQSITDETIKFIFYLEKFFSLLKINIPYSWDNIPKKRKSVFFKIFKYFLPFRYLTWLKIREILQNKNHLIVKLIKIFFKKNNSSLENNLKKDEINKKFNNLEVFYNDSNKKLLKFFDKDDIPINFNISE